MKAIELFAGAGGLGIAITKAGFKPQSIVERDSRCVNALNFNRVRMRELAHWPEPSPSDIRAEDFRKFQNKIDLVSGGPPCQPFSLGGKHKAHFDDRDMWSEAVRVVRETRPRAFIFENVKGLTRSSFSTYFSYIELQLQHPEIEQKINESWTDHLIRLQQHHTSASVSYNLVWEVLNAADYGVPQKRERVVFVGFRSDLNIAWSFPRPTHSCDALLWDQVRSNRYWDRHNVPILERNISLRDERRGHRIIGKPMEKPWRTVRDALVGLPAPTENDCEIFQNHKLQIGAKSYPGHTGSPLDEPAKTLKAGVHGVPGGENMLRMPDESVRYFSVRESARLQTFPDEYYFTGPWSESMRQIGNAVPVNLAAVVANDIARYLKKAK